MEIPSRICIEYCTAMKSFPPDLKDRLLRAMGVKPDEASANMVSWEAFVQMNRLCRFNSCSDAEVAEFLHKLWD